MELGFKDIHLLSKMGIAAATKAGLTIAQYIDKEINVEKKAGGESLASQVVTQVDFLSQKVILEILDLSLIPYDLALLTEEREDNKSRFEKDYFWCIDPLDGTLPFTERKSGFAVSIALVSKVGKPIIGVIYDPLTKTTYSAIEGQGAKRNGEPWVLNADTSPDVLTLVADRSILKQDNFSAIEQKLKAIMQSYDYKELKIVSHGGAAINAMWVIEESPALYFKLPKAKAGGGSLWDYAASACIFMELGLPVSDVYGNPLDLNREDSTFMNHKGILYSSSELSSEHLGGFL